MKSFCETRLGRLYQGDCCDILKSIPSGAVDLVVTDPPYNLVTKSASGDINPWPDLLNSACFFRAWQTEVFRILPTHGALWQFCNWRTLPAITKAVNDNGRTLTSLLVWDKGLLGTAPKRALRPGYELVALVAGPDFRIENRSLKDIQKFQWRSIKPTGHPAEKPVELMKWLIEISGAARVLDPFMGSGTTAVACEELCIPWVGCELNDEYCRIVRARVS